MRKLIKLWLIVMLTFVTVILSHIILGSTRDYVGVPPPEFVIGRWNFQYSHPASDYVIRELDFVDSDTMVADINFSDGVYYNVVFQYEFIEQDRIIISGRSGDIWQLKRNGDLLMIQSTSWPGAERVLVYKRLISINWPLIV